MLSDPRKYSKHWLSQYPVDDRIIEECLLINIETKLWDDFIFMPMLLFHNIFGRIGYFSQAIGNLKIWEYSKGIYEINSLVSKELETTDLKNVPTEIFEHLPEWCCYVKYEYDLLDLIKVYGFWVSNGVNYEDTIKKRYLQILLHTDFGVPTFINIKLEKGKDIYDCVLDGLFDFFDVSTEEEDLAEYSKIIRGNLLTLIKNMISHIIFICQKEEDKNIPMEVGNKTLNVKKTKKDKRVFKAPNYRIFKVGNIIGEKLNRLNVTNSGTKRRAHLRRAHWHTFWVGSKEKDTRTIKVQWLRPIFVGEITEENND